MNLAIRTCKSIVAPADAAVFSLVEPADAAFGVTHAGVVSTVHHLTRHTVTLIASYTPTLVVRRQLVDNTSSIPVTVSAFVWHGCFIDSMIYNM